MRRAELPREVERLRAWAGTLEPQPSAAVAELEAWARRHAPGMEPAVLVGSGGQILMLDRLALREVPRPEHDLPFLLETERARPLGPLPEGSAIVRFSADEWHRLNAWDGMDDWLEESDAALVRTRQAREELAGALAVDWGPALTALAAVSVAVFAVSQGGLIAGLAMAMLVLTARAWLPPLRGLPAVSRRQRLRGRVHGFLEGRGEMSPAEIRAAELPPAARGELLWRREQLAHARLQARGGVTWQGADPDAPVRRSLREYRERIEERLPELEGEQRERAGELIGALGAEAQRRSCRKREVERLFGEADAYLDAVQDPIGRGT